MFEALDLALLFVRNPWNLSINDLNEIVDDFAPRLLPLIPGADLDTIASRMSTEIVSSLAIPISRQIVSKASEKPDLGSSMTDMTVILHALTILIRMFPAEDTRASLQAAISHCIGRVGLHCEAILAGATRQ